MKAAEQNFPVVLQFILLHKLHGFDVRRWAWKSKLWPQINGTQKLLIKKRG